VGKSPPFWGFSTNGRFGVWWFFPPSPAAAAEPIRWANKLILHPMPFYGVL